MKKTTIEDPGSELRKIPSEIRRIYTRARALRRYLERAESEITISAGQGSGSPDSEIDVNFFTWARSAGTPERLAVAFVLNTIEKSPDFIEHAERLDAIQARFAEIAAAEEARQRAEGAAARELRAVREAAEARAAAVVEQDPEVRAAAERLAALQKPIQP
jgi:hypothetical protein